VVKFDINASQVWSKQFEIISPSNNIGYLYELPNSDIMILGLLDTMQNHNLYDITRLRLSRLDKNGNTKWSRYIGSAHNFTTSECMRGFNPTRDGGFLIAAWMYYANVSPFSIIKVDSTGCDTVEAFCPDNLATNVGFNQITGWSTELFPNPSDELVNLRIDSPVENKFRIIITDVTGRLVEEATISPDTLHKMQTSKWEAGVYMIAILHQGKVMETKRLMVVH
jgi:hypothetical protein